MNLHRSFAIYGSDLFFCILFLQTAFTQSYHNIKHQSIDFNILRAIFCSSKSVFKCSSRQSIVRPALNSIDSDVFTTKYFNNGTYQRVFTAANIINFSEQQGSLNHSNAIVQQMRNPQKIALVSLMVPIIFGLKYISSHNILIPVALLLSAYLPCVVWGMPRSNIGSWKSKISNAHRFGGIMTLAMPILATIWESMFSKHISGIFYIITASVILCNIAFGGMLIPRRIPAYDIPTTRAFAVGVLLGLSFLSLSLFFRYGQYLWYKPFGYIFAALSVYTNVYAWSDGLQHLRLYLRGHFKRDIGKKWYLPFERSTLKTIFIDNLIKQPTKEGLDASVSPANIVTVSTTILTALFALISLLQVRYLQLGTEGMRNMVLLYPDIVRWSVYEALLAVVANNFGTFAGTMVLHNKVNQRTAGVFNAIGLMIPVMNLIGYAFRNPQALASLLKTSFGSF